MPWPVHAFARSYRRSSARAVAPLLKGSARPATLQKAISQCQSPSTLPPKSAFFEIPLSLGTPFEVQTFQLDSDSTLGIAPWDSQDSPSHSIVPVHQDHTPPADIPPEIEDATWDESESDSDSDSEAQYITIHPGSPWWKPPSPCDPTSPSTSSSSSSPEIEIERRRGRSMSRNGSRNNAESPTPLPSALFLRSAHIPQETVDALRVMYCQEFTRTILASPAIEFDEDCWAMMDVSLLLAPHKAFEQTWKASLIEDTVADRHPADVPVDMSDVDVDEEWEFWDQYSSRFVRGGP